MDEHRLPDHVEVGSRARIGIANLVLRIEDRQSVGSEGKELWALANAVHEVLGHMTIGEQESFAHDKAGSRKDDATKNCDGWRPGPAGSPKARRVPVGPGSP